MGGGPRRPRSRPGADGRPRGARGGVDGGVAGRAVGAVPRGLRRRFTTLVGEPPVAYPTRWRMTVAAQLPRESDAPLATVAERTAYGSEFAFAKAFKRAYGQAPGGYRRAARERAAA
ncbi:helix-turn-helix transcriptional regulator [Streptomyces sp. AV19]|uniref:helix-turn-helix transcriptional regulator n=1 Tax=Streptomyces sp. AV19 TaxID=2793068 RepID=UPI0035ABD6F9